MRLHVKQGSREKSDTTLRQRSSVTSSAGFEFGHSSGICRSADRPARQEPRNSAGIPAMIRGFSAAGSRSGFAMCKRQRPIVDRSIGSGYRFPIPRIRSTAHASRPPAPPSLSRHGGKAWLPRKGRMKSLYTRS